MGNVAVMESNRESHELLAEAERAAAAPYIDYPPTPRWYPPAVGVWAAAMLLAVVGLEDRPAVSGPVVLALVALELWFFSWYRRYRKTWPSMRHAPDEIARAMRRFYQWLVVVVAVCAAVYFLAGLLPAVVAVFLTVTVGLARYEQAYADAAAAARERLA